MIFDHYWKKRALKAERQARHAESSARLAEAWRQEQKGAMEELSERDQCQAIAVEALQEELRSLRKQHERDLERQEALAREIEEKETTITELRGIVEMLGQNNKRLWKMLGWEETDDLPTSPCEEETAGGAYPQGTQGPRPYEGDRESADEHCSSLRENGEAEG